MTVYCMKRGGRAGRTCQVIHAELRLGHVGCAAVFLRSPLVERRGSYSPRSSDTPLFSPPRESLQSDTGPDLVRLRVPVETVEFGKYITLRRHLRTLPKHWHSMQVVPYKAHLRFDFRQYGTHILRTSRCRVSGIEAFHEEAHWCVEGIDARLEATPILWYCALLGEDMKRPYSGYALVMHFLGLARQGGIGLVVYGNGAAIASTTLSGHVPAKVLKVAGNHLLTGIVA
jgi:hypothetical protein